jgi:hypothetical protein
MPINYAPLPKDHVQRAYELESASYPSDEAASLTSLESVSSSSPFLSSLFIPY